MNAGDDLDTAEAIRGLVAALVLPRVHAVLDADAEEAVAPLLAADIASLIRRLDDRDLLELCAPELRRRLGLEEDEAVPVALETRDEAPTVPSTLPRLTDGEAVALAPEALDGGDSDDRTYDNHCAGECGELESECACDALEDEPRLPPLAQVEAELLGDNAHRVELAAPAPPRRLPVLAPELAPPVTARAHAAPPPASLVALPVKQLTSTAERFRCLPFAATITASTCLQRQRDASGTWARSSAGVQARSRALIAARCKACELGHRVAAQLKNAAA